MSTDTTLTGGATGAVRAMPLTFHPRPDSVHARAVGGRFNTLRWAMVWLTQLVFYGGVWLTWRDGDTVRPALWMDIPHERLYVFDHVLWPQDALLFAFVLIVAALALFFVTALAGRLFCGFACPQTVYTMMFTWIEARIEGKPAARRALDAAPWRPRKIALKGAKHALWWALAAWTAITFVGYFTPIRDLLPRLGTWNMGMWEGFWLIFYASFTYVQAGFAREAVCQHMCPYARFQGVMTDAHTRQVGYDSRRGEPRAHARSAGAGAGDCVDCTICVQVCPTGIDIRDGTQYACINCGLCIDACDTVMDKVGRARGLIRYASERELAGRTAAILRPRVALYAALLLLFGALGAWQIATRPEVRLDVLRDRGVLMRETADGRIENAYVLKVANLTRDEVEYVAQVEGVPGATIVGNDRLRVAADSVASLRLTVSAPDDGMLRGAQPLDIAVAPHARPDERASERSRFLFP
ncbi:cytochrome c oxidase accessory protein CcoG [Methyloversatilis thermotolerans]|uniref:cytochrome c oxidase accessory protein CcoG n=1 Tax=Methyloversatilis thermotolerans TaxID=1346290 RepID=UPI00037D886F|nr:cytochrome c oxidase accessory protein CcoG [Methyloversatilis thermotolerans]